MRRSIAATRWSPAATRRSSSTGRRARPEDRAPHSQRSGLLYEREDAVDLRDERERPLLDVEPPREPAAERRADVRAALAPERAPVAAALVARRAPDAALPAVLRADVLRERDDVERLRDVVLRDVVLRERDVLERRFEE